MTHTNCKECGGSPVHHTPTYISSLFNIILDPFARGVNSMVSAALYEKLMIVFARTFVALGLVSVRTKPEQAGTWRARALWEEAERRDIQLTEILLFGRSRDIFVSNFENDRRFFEGLPRPHTYNRSGGGWMDYKSKIKKRFITTDIPVARGGTVWSKSAARELFSQLNKPVIVKPNDGSRSRHTRVHISDEQSLIDAFKSARKLGPLVMIEEELSGFVFRGTLIGKKLVAVCRREPAYVTGDGVNTVRELVDRENNNSLRQGPIFQQIPIDAAVEGELAHQGKKWETVPGSDEYVALGQKTSRALGGGITDVTDTVHPDNVAFLEKIAETIDDPLIGVDFIMEDVVRSWRVQPRSGVIECNGSPFIDLHHYPLVGKPRNVAGALWDIIYPSSKSSQQ